MDKGTNTECQESGLSRVWNEDGERCKKKLDGVSLNSEGRKR